MTKRLFFAALAAAAVLYSSPARATLTTSTLTVTCLGTGAPMTCALPYRFFNNSDLVVTLGGVLQTIGTQYTVSCAGCQSGGSVTMVSAPGNGVAVVVTRLLPYLQLFDPRTQGQFRPASYGDAYDNLDAQIQQLAAIVTGQAGGIVAASVIANSPIIGTGVTSDHLRFDFTVANTWTALQTFTPSSGDTNAITATGHGTGSGIGATGGGTNGQGIFAQGVGSGSGVVGAGASSGSGAGVTGNGGQSGPGGVFTGAGNSNTPASGAGVVAQGFGVSPGTSSTGGATGPGGAFIGGATSGAGLTATASAGNSNGVTATGHGANAGVNATGGATGNGGTFAGGATSGSGIQATATAGVGGSFNGGGSGPGVSASGGAGAVNTAYGGLFSGGSGGSSAGVFATGSGTAAGVSSVGGPTSGAGGSFTGGGPNGAGITVLALGNGYAATFTPGVLGSPVTATLNVATVVNDPSAPANGDLWVQGASANTLKARQNGATQSVLTTGTNVTDNASTTIPSGTGSLTHSSTAATARAGARFGDTRVVSRTTNASPPDCAAATLTLTVTQFLDIGIATCGTAQTINFPTWQGASGIVQGLPGAPAVGDIIGPIGLVATAASALTPGFGTGGTNGGGTATVAANTTRWFYCRLTSVTANSETATCY